MDLKSTPRSDVAFMVIYDSLVENNSSGPVEVIRVSVYSSAMV